MAAVSLQRLDLREEKGTIKNPVPLSTTENQEL
jgi:hypothetical protein